jgi:UrcA family protein
MFGFASYSSTGLRSLAFGLAVLAAAGPALSQPSSSHLRVQADGHVSAVITTNDLDLTTDAGRKELQNRVKFAAWKACHESASDALLSAMHEQCEAAAIAGAADMERHVIAAAAARSYAGAAATPVSFADRPEQ